MTTTLHADLFSHSAGEEAVRGGLALGLSSFFLALLLLALLLLLLLPVLSPLFLPPPLSTPLLLLPLSTNSARSLEVVLVCEGGQASRRWFHSFHAAMTSCSVASPDEMSVM